MGRWEGFELSTKGLQNPRSTTELPSPKRQKATVIWFSDSITMAFSFIVLATNGQYTDIVQAIYRQYKTKFYLQWQRANPILKSVTQAAGLYADCLYCGN